MKKALVTALAVFAAAIAFLGIAVPLTNDAAAGKTARDLSEIPLPEDTEFLEKVSLAGKLTGNGNGMQYFGAILLRSKLPLEELQAYYGKFAENPWSCVVATQQDSTVEQIEHGKLSFRSGCGGNDYFIVYSWGENSELFSELDFRGH